MGREKKEKRSGHRRASRNSDYPDISTLAWTGARTLALGGTAGCPAAASAGVTGPLPETIAEVPILAFKRCRLSWSPGGTFRLVSSHTKETIELDADAKCKPNDGGLFGFTVNLSTYYQSAFGLPATPTKEPAPKDHAAPHPNCNCGFHAAKTAEQTTISYGTVQLDVELSGRVVVHETGYRAEHQRVLRARMGGCYYCGEPVAAFIILTSVDAPATVNPLCEAHIRPEDRTITPELLAKRLSIPFSCDTVDA